MPVVSSQEPGARIRLDLRWLQPRPKVHAAVVALRKRGHRVWPARRTGDRRLHLIDGRVRTDEQLIEIAEREVRK